jgi:8-oxo-dGTP diphosphatase
MKTIMQVAAKGLVVNDEGKILILREPVKDNPGSKDGLYGLPGGRMEVDETYEQALKREVKEEAGLDVDVLYPIFVGEWSPVINGVKCHIVALFSVCKAKTTDVKLSFEHDDYKWINPEQIDDYPTMDMEPKVIKRYTQIKTKL